jgi:hypothetical protein
MNISSTDTDDDAFIEVLIGSASRQIDTYTKRWFYGEEQTRRFNSIVDVVNWTLFVDQDFTEITEIINGNNEVVPPEAYILVEPNMTPYWGIELLWSSSIVWTFITNPQNAIRVTGVWGYVNGTNGTDAPEPIQHAATSLVSWMYAQRAAPFTTVGLPESQQSVVPAVMPQFITGILDTYVRRTVPFTGH